VTTLGRVGHKLVAGGFVNIERLKWATIVLPAAALFVIVILLRSSLHDWLHEFPGFVLLAGVFALCIFLFASVVFAVVDDIEQRTVDQNRRLSDLLARTDRQNTELSAFLSVGRASASSVELSDMLDEALAAVLAVTHAESAELWLEDRGRLVLECFRGEGEAALGSRPSFLVGEGLPGTAARATAAVVVHDAALDARFDSEEVRALGLRTFCALPLRVRDRTVGVLAAASREEAAFTSPDELRVLEGIGEQVALGIENARLHEQVLDRAVLEERERIARELHDGLAQVLGFINTQTQAVKKLLESGKEEEATVELDAMGAVSRDVYSDVREAIVGLRVSSKGLVPAIREYVSRLPKMGASEIDVRVEGDADNVSLAPSTEIQLVRIVQEALNNVRKYAAASTIEVIVEADTDTIGIEIVDDGHGFDPLELARTGWPRLGLQTMRERAQAIGGTFDVVSTPGEGTRVSVRAPRVTQREVAGARGPR
jgi:signal transduction histidine kinase